ncbi:uncharacterized protein EHS24_005609 [Apiotrichum porosum]|uniref:ferric-chelate reductase (NADPH) n=1 Tax=Apiotrichum porosum TaxID=105984 RepID=A0A427XZ46_9TREE|nr:uncharacterized protein EHS24_005609 [Apiotrichum porosum]RSH84110.1 hypothetical protein EHS24_005609 [Apiotrichum porosum]
MAHESSSGSTGSSSNSTGTSSGSAATTTTAAAASKNNKANKNAAISKATYDTWYVIAGVTGACMAVYLFSVANAWYIRRRVAAARRAGKAASPPAATTGASVSISRVPKALNAVFANIAYYRVWPLWIWSATSTAEWWWTWAYTGIVLGLGFWGCISNGKLDYANPMGYVAFGQIPLIVALSSRNNVLSWLTGISYEKLNYLHRASGRLCVLTTWLHTLGWFKKGLGKHGPGTNIFLTGMLAAVAALIMWLTSFALARKIAYEFFLISHITMGIIFIVGSYYHWPRLGEWCWVGLVIWAFDRVLATCRMMWVNKVWLMPFSSKRAAHSACTVELVDPDVVRLTVNRPNMKWSPAQHAYITMPGVATLRYEQHPMTIANIQSETGDVTFIIRAQTGFTRRLVHRLTEQKSSDINCYLDGPYGMSHGLNHYDSVILVSGGTGVTYGTAHLLSIMEGSRNATTAVSNCRLVWNVREAANVSWIAPMINEAVAKGLGQTRFHIDIYITRSAASDEPGTAHVAPIEDTATPEYSPSGSTENVNDKGSASSLGDEKYASIAGLSAEAAQLVSWHRGRSHIEGILRSDRSESATDGAGVAVACCGPSGLTLDARRAVCKVNSAGSILRGQNDVTFYSELFGW